MSEGIKKLDENIVALGRSFTIVNSSTRDNTNFQIGTLRCYPTESGLRYKAAANDYRLFDADKILEDYTIVDNLIGNQQVTTRALKDLCVTTDKIADRNVTRPKIAIGAVGESEIDNGAVKTRHITDLNVTTEKLADHCVDSNKLKDGAVIQGKIAKDAVLSLNIVNNAITTSKIMNSAVTNEKITDNTIENSKLKDFTIQGGSEKGTGKIAEKTITAYNIADATITGSQIKDGGITGKNIAIATITGSNIAHNTIETGNIGTEAVTSDKLATDSVITVKIQDKAITKEKLADDVYQSVLNAVVYEVDAQGKNCVRIKDGTYFNVLGGDVNVNGNLTATRVYNMAYSDLAEGYIPGEELEPGDTVYLYEDGKVYKDRWKDNKFSVCVGVVSDEYAMCLGATDEELKNGDKVAVALVGKVHVKCCWSSIHLGETVQDSYGTKVGKALETIKDNEFWKKHNYIKVLTLVYPH